METQQTNTITEPELAQLVRFYKEKIDSIYLKMENFQSLTPDNEVDLLWLYRADELYNDHKFEVEKESRYYVEPPKKKYKKHTDKNKPSKRKKTLPPRNKNTVTK